MIDLASIKQHHVEERARDDAERLRIANAQADERTHVDVQIAAALARNRQLEAERAAAVEREHAR